MAVTSFATDRVLRLSNISTSLFNAIDGEAKELLPRSIFIITRRYRRVEIERCNRVVVA
jgi:hypothetical protein